MQLTWHPTLAGTVAREWEAACTEFDVHPFQSRIGAIARAHHHGQQIGFLTGYCESRLAFGAAVQLRSSPLFPLRLAVTRGPWAIDAETLLAGLTEWLRSPPPSMPKAMALQVDVHVPLPAPGLEDPLRKLGFRPATLTEFLPHTTVVDLTRSEAELLASFRTLTRRQLRKADSLGLKTYVGGAADIDRYLELHARVAPGKGYATPNASWLHTMHQDGQGFVVLTERSGQVIGGAYIGKGPATLYYHFGATDPAHAGPASYHAFWHVMRWGRQEGFRRFDLGAVPDDHQGIAFFKQGFGGQNIQSLPELEYIYRPLCFQGWLAARRLMGR